MSISDKQLAANRANARKSTGPRTGEGKRRSAQNAFQHGVLPKAILIQGECEEAFLDLCKACEREYDPQSATEHALVNKAVTAQWRALRGASLESAAITHEIQREAEITASDDDTTRAMFAVRALQRLREKRTALRELPPPQPTTETTAPSTPDDAPITGVSSEEPSPQKMNLNKPTHFDEATKELITKKPISKPIFDPSKAA